MIVCDCVSLCVFVCVFVWLSGRLFKTSKKKDCIGSIHPGDVVTCILDFDKNSLSFEINGELQPTSITGVRKHAPLYAAFFGYGPGRIVKLLGAADAKGIVEGKGKSISIPAAYLTAPRAPSITSGGDASEVPLSLSLTFDTKSGVSCSFSDGNATVTNVERRGWARADVAMSSGVHRWWFHLVYDVYADESTALGCCVASPGESFSSPGWFVVTAETGE